MLYAGECYMLESVICWSVISWNFWRNNLLLYAYEMLYAGECAGVFCCWRSVLVCFAGVICLWDVICWRVCWCVLLLEISAGVFCLCYMLMRCCQVWMNNMSCPFLPKCWFTSVSVEKWALLGRKISKSHAKILNFSVALCTNYLPLFNEVQINMSGTSNPKSQEEVAREANKEWWQEYDKGKGQGGHRRSRRWGRGPGWGRELGGRLRERRWGRGPGWRHRDRWSDHRPHGRW
jgi:hypothetical protein